MTSTFIWGRCTLRWLNRETKQSRGLCLSQRYWKMTALWTGKQPHYLTLISGQHTLKSVCRCCVCYMYACFPLLALPLHVCSSISAFSRVRWRIFERELKCSLPQVHPVPPASEHPGTGREPDREVQLQLRGGSYSRALKLNQRYIVNQPIVYWKYLFSYLFPAYEQAEYRKPPGDSGLSGYTEERFDKCCETGSSLSLGRERDVCSWGGYCSMMESS